MFRQLTNKRTFQFLKHEFGLNKNIDSSTF